MEGKTYQYKQKVWIGPAIAMFFSFAAYLFVQKAQKTSRGVAINRVIELSPQQAPYLYWGLFAASMAFVLMGLYVFRLSLRPARKIELHPTRLVVPRNAASSGYIEVPYAQISSMKVQNVFGQRILEIRHPGGKIAIPQSMLASKSDFDEIVSSLRLSASVG